MSGGEGADISVAIYAAPHNICVLHTVIDSRCHESDTEPFQRLREAAPDPVAEEQGPAEFGIDEGGNRSCFGDRSLVRTDETLTREEKQNC